MADKEYQEKLLGDIAEFRNGKAISPERYLANGKYPVFGANGEIARSEEILNSEPVIAIGRVGAYCGSVHYIPEPSWITDNAIIVIPKNQNNLRYLFYLLRSLDLRRTAIGSAQPLMTQGGLNIIRAFVAPLKQQQAIACILGALDDKIELNRRMNETLEAMAQVIFKSWFVDFYPVRAKAEGQLPPGLKPKIAALFPSTFEDSELGKIPKGWKVRPITADIDIIAGGTPRTSVPEYWDGEIPWFSVIDTPTEGEVFVISTQKAVTKAGVDNSSTSILPLGTTIISARGTVGNLALVGVPMAMNQSCYGLRDRRSAEGYFLYFLLRNNIEGLRQRTHGSVFNTITRNTLDSLQVVAPPNDIIQAFESVVGAKLQKVLITLRESKTLSDLRDILLSKLISGELRVPHADRIAGRAL